MRRPGRGSNDVIEVSDVRKRYGKVQALDGIDLTIRKGEVVGILGPNGAGKTTLLESIVGLRRTDEGSVSVLGHDPLWDHRLLAERVSMQPQEAALFPMLTVRETLRLWCSFYPAATEVDVLLDALGLADHAGQRVKRLSGGQRQRLRLATAMAGRCELRLFDEPTTGLDPQARERVWEIVAQRGGDETIVLTTHLMEEAENLCDRIVVIDRGRVVADGSFAELVTAYAPGSAVVATVTGTATAESFRRIPGVDTVLVTNRGRTRQVRAMTTRPELVAGNLRGSADIDTRSVTVRPASLHDVFLALTGRELREEN